MALKNTLDLDQAAKSIAGWWSDQNPDARRVVVSDLHVPKSSGMSSETVLFRIDWQRDGAEHTEQLVIRLIHADGQIFPSHDFEQERRAMDTVRTSAHQPAPLVHLVEHDSSVLGAPFMLMSRMYGDVLPDDPPFTAGGWFLDLDVAAQATLVDNGLVALAGVHRADVSMFGPETLGHPDRGGRPIVQHIEFWEQLYRWAAAGRTHPIIEAALEWIGANTPTDDGPVALCWGDARLGNMMFGPDQSVTAVLDWELSCLGPPELDLSWFNLLNRTYTEGFGIPAPPGFPDEQQTIERYEELASRPVRDYTFHQVFAGLRASIILLRMALMMIDTGLLEPDAPLPISNPFSHGLAGLLGIAAPSADAAGWVTGHR